MHLANAGIAVKTQTPAPSDSGYLVLAAEVDWRGLVRRDRRHKKQLIALTRDWCTHLAMRPDVVEANVFRAVLVAPRARADTVHHARYDVVVLIRTANVAAARRLREDYEYRALANTVRVSAKYIMEVIAHDAIRLGDADQRPDHVFLFNFFHAADNADFIPVFEYASWPSLLAFLPRLIFRPSFRSFVLANFAASRIAVQPVFYRLVTRSAD
jgi:hypothetical protein